MKERPRLDEQFARVAGSLTPTAEEHLVRFATWMPLGCAAQMLQALSGAQAPVRQHQEQMGKVGEEQQDEQSQSQTNGMPFSQVRESA